MAAAVAVRTEGLGLRVIHQEEDDEQGVAAVLLPPLAATSPRTRFLDRSGPGGRHLATGQKHVDHTTEVLQKKGLRLLYDSAKPGTPGSRINFIHPKDAGGVLIDLVEPAAVDPEPGGRTWGGPSTETDAPKTNNREQV